MPIDFEHPKYVARSKQWRKCRDAYEGEDAIKAAGTLYLPKLKGQSDEDYGLYKRRALFYSITSKSVSALVGMATSRQPKLTYPESMTKYFKDSKTIQFSEIFSTALCEVLIQSRAGLLVDFPQDGGDPYPVVYVAEDIINWRVNEQGDPILVVLKEVYDREIDEYQTETSIRYRELRIDEQGNYVQILHETPNASSLRSVSGTTVDVSPSSYVSTSIVPTLRGKPLTAIPFVAVNPFGIGFGDYKPMMLDIANINISHYLSSADLEHGRHFTGLPTPVIIGGSAESDLFIGSTKFLVIPEKGGDAKYLEFTGQGLQSLEKAMSEKHGQLASLSARLLDNSSRGSEAAEAVKLRYSSETASLTTVVNSLSIALNLVYGLIAEFLDEGGSCSIVLDTDFMEAQMSAADMNSLFDGYLGGAISKETLVYNLRRGQRLDPNRSNDDELRSIKAPVTAPQTTNNFNGNKE